MIFAGDIASPSEDTTACLNKALSHYADIFKGRRIICNFEGLISEILPDCQNEPVLFNHPAILDALDTGQKPVLCLANNHILDLPEQFRQTTGLLFEKGVSSCGAGLSVADAEKPVVFAEGSNKIVIFNACWDFLMYNQKNPSAGVYVAELKEEDLIREVQQVKIASPEVSVVVYLHWNFDLETLPFPMHRRFSRDLIDAGASLVVGSHSHCVQGGESYKEGYIVYGLGNFFMPHNQFIGGKLVYPDFTSTELSLEWDPSSNNAVCHWFRYEHKDETHRLIHLVSEKFEDSKVLASYSPYAGMKDDEYLCYFRKNRRKKILIPVFADYRNHNLNRIYTRFLKNRARLARRMAKLGLIKWQN